MAKLDKMHGYTQRVYIARLDEGDHFPYLLGQHLHTWLATLLVAEQDRGACMSIEEQFVVDEEATFHG